MDEIQRKLALIDKQHAGGREFQRQITGTAPLVFAATGLIAGILIQNAADWPAGLWLILLGFCAIGTFGLFAVRKEAGLPVVVAYMAFACFVCLGAIRLTSFYQARPNDIRNLVGDEPRLATIRGLIITEPYVNSHPQWAFARFQPGDPTSSFYLKVRQVQTTGGWAKVIGTVRVQVDEPVLDLKAGDYVQAYCWLDRFRQPSNPGQFDTARYLARRDVFIAASVKSRDGIELLGSHHKGAFVKIKGKLSQTAAQALLGSPSPEDPNESLLQALLLGCRRNIDSETYQAFRKTGLLHFISLSGMHLGILIGIIWWLCKTAGLMKRAQAAVCIIAIAVFLLIVPPRAPTLRAAIIGWAFCVSFFFRRQPNSLNTLSLAAIILLLIRPTQLFEADWQLSFASVLAIILFADQIHLRIYEKVTNISSFRKAPESNLFSHIITELRRYVLGMFSVGLAAWSGGAGILLYHFCTINPLTSIWTSSYFHS
jgi:competence protein ComEC